jgi:hypothetical protein
VINKWITYIWGKEDTTIPAEVVTNQETKITNNKIAAFSFWIKVTQKSTHSSGLDILLVK